jgi:aryl-alcohol dehydrogenase-like predicted oxidoreductase
VLPLLAQQGISLIARGPVAKGLLADGGAGKVKAEGYLDYDESELRECLRQLQQLPHDGSLAQTAIRYALAHPAVATAIPGARTLQQLQVNVQAADIPPLTDGQLRRLRELSKANVYTDHR